MNAALKHIGFWLFVLLAVYVLTGCAATPSDPWREAAHKPVDTGSYIWWDKVKADN